MRDNCVTVSVLKYCLYCNVTAHSHAMPHGGIMEQNTQQRATSFYIIASAL